jgi:hypothetical protein
MLTFSNSEAVPGNTLAGPTTPSKPFGALQFPAKALIVAGDEGAVVALTLTPAANSPDSLANNEVLSLLTSSRYSGTWTLLPVGAV